MKTKLICLSIFLFVSIKTVLAFAEVQDSINSELSIHSSDSIPDTINYGKGEIEENNSIIKEQIGDTTFITLGKKRIKIFEENGDTSVKIEEKDKKEKQDFAYKGHDKKRKHFKGHWAGFEFGLNNYVNSNLSFDRSPEEKFMDLKAGKSWNFNFNFAQYSMGIGGDRFGITTGMGLEWNNYHFSDTNIIQKQNGIIVSKATPENTKRNRLQTTYLTIPLLLELQFPNCARQNRAYLSMGGIMGIKLFSNTKIKYIEGGNKQKEKYKSDYYLNSLRFGLTARLGYKDVAVYMNYYLTPVFIEDHGPELYPLAAGLVLSF
jgi:hypothetical protein